MSSRLPDELQIPLKAAAVLLAFTLVFTALMAATHDATLAPIAASAQAEKLRVIGEVLPASAYDNDLLHDSLELPPTPELGLKQASRLYRARHGKNISAVVFEAAAPDGYSGHIGLILAIAADGELQAVRVIEHKETPGLGDYIDPRKDKNKERPWIKQFDQLSSTTLPLAAWRVQKDGGHFEQRSGATITARAVTQAVARAMQWFQAQQASLLSVDEE